MNKCGSTIETFKMKWCWNFCTEWLTVRHTCPSTVYQTVECFVMCALDSTCEPADVSSFEWWHTCTCVCMDLLLTCDVDVLVLFIGVEQAHWRACLFYTFNKGIITMLFYTDVISNINVTLICLFVICEKVQWNQTKITYRHYNLKVSHFLQQKKFFLGSECCYL